MSADDVVDFGAAVDVVLGDPLFLGRQPVLVVSVPRNPALVSHPRRNSGAPIADLPHKVKTVGTLLQGDCHFRGSELSCLE